MTITYGEKPIVGILYDVIERPATQETIYVFGRNNYEDPKLDFVSIVNRHPSRIEGKFSLRVQELYGPQIVEAEESQALDIGWTSSSREHR